MKERKASSHTMQPNLMPLIDNHPTLLRKRLERMSRDEESRLDAILGEQLEQSTHADCAGKESLRFGRSSAFVSPIRYGKMALRWCDELRRRRGVVCECECGDK